MDKWVNANEASTEETVLHNKTTVASNREEKPSGSSFGDYLSLVTHKRASR